MVGWESPSGCSMSHPQQEPSGASSRMETMRSRVGSARAERTGAMASARSAVTAPSLSGVQQTSMAASLQDTLTIINVSMIIYRLMVVDLKGEPMTVHATETGGCCGGGGCCCC